MKKPFPVSLDEEMIKWIGEQVVLGSFRNKSHVVEEALKDFKRKVDSGTLSRYI